MLLLEAGIEEPKVTEIPALFTLYDGSNILKNYPVQPEEKSCLSRPCSFVVGQVSNL